MPPGVEAERDEGGARWSSYSPHEQDLRAQKNGREYDSYTASKPPRPPRPPGHPADASQASRNPNVQNPLANQQSAGRRKTTAVAHHVIRREGPNWVLLAGGALVTAIGATLVMIVRKRTPPSCEEKIIEKAVPAPEKDHVQQSGISFATTRRESTGSRSSEPSADSSYSGDAYMIAHNLTRSQSDGSRVGSDWGDDECIPHSPPAAYYHPQLCKGSNHSGRTIITPTSPPGSYRGADTSATEGNDLPLSPVSRSGYSSRRDTVHRLRQQLKSRDDTIDDMRARILNQERTISLHQAHCRDLEGRLDAAGRTLFDSEREIQRLRKAVADYLTNHSPASENWDPPHTPDVGLAYPGEGRGDRDYPETTIDVFLAEQQQPGQDLKALLLETHRLTEELNNQETQKRELEKRANAKLMEHEVMLERLHQLEEELEDARKEVFEKDLLLQAYETQQFFHDDAVDDLKRKLETHPNKVKGNNTSSLIGRQSLSGGLGSIYMKYSPRGKKEEYSSFKADSCKFPAGVVVRTNCALFEKSSDQFLTHSTSAKSWVKTDESSSTGDASEDSDMEDVNPTAGTKILMKLQEEVENLSVALAEHSQMIAEKRIETSLLVDEFQRHNNDLQMRMDETGDSKSESEEQDWEKLSRLLSFSNGGTSAAQVQELGHKLEQIAKEQRVEEEMAELAKHQVKIRELKNRVEKLLSKFSNLQDKDSVVDTTTHQQATHITSVGLELSKQLSLREKQAKRTSKEVARLSASFQLSSPYVPRTEKDALQKMLQRGSSESPSPGMDSGSLEPLNLSQILSAVQARLSTGREEKTKESGDTLFDRTISVSSAELAMAKNEGCSASPLQEQYVYRPGFTGPSSRKFRRGFPIGSVSVNEPFVVGGKRRVSRNNKRGSSSEDREMVRRDSNRWSNKPRFQLASADATRQLFLSISEPSARQQFFETDPDDSSLDIGDWMKEETIVQSAPETESLQVEVVRSGRRDSPKSRRQSTSSFQSIDDSVVRMGSPTVAEDHSFRPDATVESTKGSFGRFIFDMEEGSEVYVITPDEACHDGSPAQEALPVRQLIASLELPASPANSAEEDGSFGSSISGLSTEMLNAVREKRSQGGRGEKSSGSSSSLDSSLDCMLDTALDDMVRMVSPPSSPAETVESSFMSSLSE